MIFFKKTNVSSLNSKNSWNPPETFKSLQLKSFLKFLSSSSLIKMSSLGSLKQNFSDPKTIKKIAVWQLSQKNTPLGRLPLESIFLKRIKNFDAAGCMVASDHAAGGPLGSVKQNFTDAKTIKKFNVAEDFEDFPAKGLPLFLKKLQAGKRRKNYRCSRNFGRLAFLLITQSSRKELSTCMVSTFAELNTGAKSFWNQTFDKNRLKNFVLWFLLKHGEYKTVKLVEELKTLGFQYATKAGISLGIEDLKIPTKKNSLIMEAEQLSIATIKQYKRSEITGVERFQRLIDTWHRTSERLKQEVIENFEATDILNPVYMMAFSGARGNISQVRQLVGMRGLMSNPQGQIIDFPIRSNFREGLTLTEYIISSYGARKGIVDTALRTANAGYLTRRLVDVAQHVIISNFDCGTKRGIFLNDMKEGNKTIYSLQNRLIGRVLARDIFMSAKQKNLLKSENLILNKSLKVASRNIEISSDLSISLASICKKVFVRSALTCQTKNLVCQLCYGWSLAQGNLVGIGEAVGVVAAQSIGEPGTQLTMRTFHTGGVYSGDVSDQIRAPFNGVVTYDSPIAGTLIRTPEGKIAFLTKNEGSFTVETLYNKQVEGSSSASASLNTFKEVLTLESETGKSNLSETFTKVKAVLTKKFKIPFYTLLFFKNGEKVIEKEVIAQISSINRQKNATDQAEFTINAELSGQFFSKFLNLKENKVGPKLKGALAYKVATNSISPEKTSPRSFLKKSGFSSLQTSLSLPSLREKEEKENKKEVSSKVFRYKPSPSNNLLQSPAPCPLAKVFGMEPAAGKVLPLGEGLSMQPDILAKDFPSNLKKNTHPKDFRSENDKQEILIEQFDENIVDTIFEAWGWGYAWVLAGKIYQLPLASTFFPIIGDFVNHKTYMNKNQLSLPSSFGSSLKLSIQFPNSAGHNVFFNKKIIKQMRTFTTNAKISPYSTNILSNFLKNKNLETYKGGAGLIFKNKIGIKPFKNLIANDKDFPKAKAGEVFLSHQKQNFKNYFKQEVQIPISPSSDSSRSKKKFTLLKNSIHFSLAQKSRDKNGSLNSLSNKQNEFKLLKTELISFQLSKITYQKLGYFIKLSDSLRGDTKKKNQLHGKSFRWRKDFPCSQKPTLKFFLPPITQMKGVVPPNVSKGFPIKSVNQDNQTIFKENNFRTFSEALVPPKSLNNFSFLRQPRSKTYNLDAKEALSNILSIDDTLFLFSSLGNFSTIRRSVSQENDFAPSIQSQHSKKQEGLSMLSANQDQADTLLNLENSTKRLDKNNFAYPSNWSPSFDIFLNWFPKRFSTKTGGLILIEPIFLRGIKAYSTNEPSDLRKTSKQESNISNSKLSSSGRLPSGLFFSTLIPEDLQASEKKENRLPYKKPLEKNTPLGSLGGEKSLPLESIFLKQLQGKSFLPTKSSKSSKSPTTSVFFNQVAGLKGSDSLFTKKSVSKEKDSDFKKESYGQKFFKNKKIQNLSSLYSNQKKNKNDFYPKNFSLEDWRIRFAECSKKNFSYTRKAINFSKRSDCLSFLTGGNKEKNGLLKINKKDNFGGLSQGDGFLSNTKKINLKSPTQTIKFFPTFVKRDLIIPQEMLLLSKNKLGSRLNKGIFKNETQVEESSSLPIGVSSKARFLPEVKRLRQNYQTASLVFEQYQSRELGPVPALKVGPASAPIIQQLRSEGSFRKGSLFAGAASPLIPTKISDLEGQGNSIKTTPELSYGSRFASKSKSENFMYGLNWKNSFKLNFPYGPKKFDSLYYTFPSLREDNKTKLSMRQPLRGFASEPKVNDFEFKEKIESLQRIFWLPQSFYTFSFGKLGFFRFWAEKTRNTSSNAFKKKKTAFFKKSVSEKTSASSKNLIRSKVFRDEVSIDDLKYLDKHNLDMRMAFNLKKTKNFIPTSKVPLFRSAKVPLRSKMELPFYKMFQINRQGKVKSFHLEEGVLETITEGRNFSSFLKKSNYSFTKGKEREDFLTEQNKVFHRSNCFSSCRADLKKTDRSEVFRYEPSKRKITNINSQLRSIRPSIKTNQEFLINLGNVNLLNSSLQIAEDFQASKDQNLLSNMKAQMSFLKKLKKREKIIYSSHNNQKIESNKLLGIRLSVKPAPKFEKNSLASARSLSLGNLPLESDISVLHSLPQQTLKSFSKIVSFPYFLNKKNSSFLASKNLTSTSLTQTSLPRNGSFVIGKPALNSLRHPKKNQTSLFNLNFYSFFNKQKQEGDLNKTFSNSFYSNDRKKSKHSSLNSNFLEKTARVEVFRYKHSHSDRTFDKKEKVKKSSRFRQEKINQICSPFLKNQLKYLFSFGKNTIKNAASSNSESLQLDQNLIVLGSEKQSFMDPKSNKKGKLIKTFGKGETIKILYLNNFLSSSSFVYSTLSFIYKKGYFYLGFEPFLLSFFSLPKHSKEKINKKRIGFASINKIYNNNTFAKKERSASINEYRYPDILSGLSTESAVQQRKILFQFWLKKSTFYKKNYIKTFLNLNKRLYSYLFKTNSFLHLNNLNLKKYQSRLRLKGDKNGLSKKTHKTTKTVLDGSKFLIGSSISGRLSPTSKRKSSNPKDFRSGNVTNLSINLLIKPGWPYFTNDISNFFLSNKKLIQPGKIIGNDLIFDRQSIFLEIIPLNNAIPILTAKDTLSKSNFVYNSFGLLLSFLLPNPISNSINLRESSESLYQFNTLNNYKTGYKVKKKKKTFFGNSENNLQTGIQQNIWVTKVVVSRGSKKSRYEPNNFKNIMSIFNKTQASYSQQSEALLTIRQSKNLIVQRKKFTKFLILIRTASEYKLFKDSDYKKEIHKIANKKTNSLNSLLRVAHSANEQEEEKSTNNLKINKTFNSINLFSKFKTPLLNKQKISSQTISKFPSSDLKVLSNISFYSSLVILKQILIRTSMIRQNFTKNNFLTYSSDLKTGSRSGRLSSRSEGLSDPQILSMAVWKVLPPAERLSMQQEGLYSEEKPQKPYSFNLNSIKASFSIAPITAVSSINLSPLIISSKIPYSFNFLFKTPMRFFSEQHNLKLIFARKTHSDTYKSETNPSLASKASLLGDGGPSFVFVKKKKKHSPHSGRLSSGLKFDPLGRLPLLKQSFESKAEKQIIVSRKAFPSKIPNLFRFASKDSSSPFNVDSSLLRKEVLLNSSSGRLPSGASMQPIKKLLNNYLFKIHSLKRHNISLKVPPAYSGRLPSESNFLMQPAPRPLAKVFGMEPAGQKNLEDFPKSEALEAMEGKAFSQIILNSASEHDKTSYSNFNSKTYPLTNKDISFNFLLNKGKITSVLSSLFYCPIAEYSLGTNLEKSILYPNNLTTFYPIQNSDLFKSNVNNVYNKNFLTKSLRPLGEISKKPVGSILGSLNNFLDFRPKYRINKEIFSYKTEFESFRNNEISSLATTSFINTYTYCSFEGELIFKSLKILPCEEEQEILKNGEGFEGFRSSSGSLPSGNNLNTETNQISQDEDNRLENLENALFANKRLTDSCMILTKKDQFSYYLRDNINSFLDKKQDSRSDIALPNQIKELSMDKEEELLIKKDYNKTNFPISILKEMGNTLKSDFLERDKIAYSGSLRSLRSLPIKMKPLVLQKNVNFNYKEIYFSLENLKKKNQYVINDTIIKFLNILDSNNISKEDTDISVLAADFQADNLPFSSENPPYPAPCPPAGMEPAPASKSLIDLGKNLPKSIKPNNDQINFKLNKLPMGMSQQRNRFLLGEFLVYGDQISPYLAVTKPGQIIHINNKKITMRQGQPIFVSPKAILHKYDTDFIEEQSPIITLAYQQLKTGDIIQGIPKVEQFFEARTTKRGRLFRDSLANLLKGLFKRYCSKGQPIDQAVRQSFYKIQQIIVDGVQRVYRSQGVSIADKHLEVIVKQMTSKVRIIEGGQTGFFPGEIVDLNLVEEVNSLLMRKITYEPLVLGITKASLEVDSFLSAASFQQTTRVLSNAAISKKKDFLKGLKENVILGNLIPAGTGYLVYLNK
jgi:hypothetical protein